ncbi:uncharacterized protein CDAR_28511 [Caerostris darwini]|uniref:Uncharacterized protein n=1 Tax=Caerostris darwini TaxID=1538125 RepID=A0AAV4Q4I4_9ARAC|nr:uncharacterized protein CDAR_28511 [Caerostris darwini]
MNDRLQGGDAPWVNLKKAASHESLFTRPTAVGSSSFCEELADALLQRASSLRNFHPTVRVGREEKLIEGLIDLARAIRPAPQTPQEEQVPQQDDPEDDSEDEEQSESPQHNLSEKSSLKIPKHGRFGTFVQILRRKGSQQKSLWSSMRKRFINRDTFEKLSPNKENWNRLRKRLRRGWKSSRSTLVELVDSFCKNSSKEQKQTIN